MATADQRDARWALNQTVHRLRSGLGASVIQSHGSDAIGVDPATL